MKDRRDEIVGHLKRLWDKRDIPHIPDVELKRFGQDTLAYLLRFWAHKDRWWDNENAPDFAEDAPTADVRMNRPATARSFGTPSAPSSANFGRTFKGTGGGFVTPRQSLHIVSRQ